MRQIPLPIGEPPAPSFDNFVVGANEAALAHLRSVPADPAPIYLWAPSGAGKTHLLHALADDVRRRGGRVGWFGATEATPWRVDGFDADHTPDAIGSIAADGASAADGSRVATIVPSVLAVLDGCDDFDAARQHAAFALFVDAATHGVAIVAAGRVPPVDLPLRDDLRTRLGWGHVFAIEPLREADTRVALQHEAARRGVALADDVMHYLMTRFPRNLKYLMAQLQRLDDFSLATHRPVTVPLLKQMLSQEMD